MSNNHNTDGYLDCAFSAPCHTLQSSQELIHRFFVSDEGAVTDPHNPESFRSGTDVYLGPGPSEQDFTTWSRDGEIPKGRVDDAARRTLLPRFLLGEFDDPSTVPFWDHAGGCGVVGAQKHRQLAYEAAAQSFVLLKNDGALPLAKGKKIALVGPFTNATWYAAHATYLANGCCLLNGKQCV